MKICLVLLASLSLISCVTAIENEYKPTKAGKLVKIVTTDPSISKSCKEVGDVEYNGFNQSHSNNYLKSVLRDRAAKMGANVVRLEFINSYLSRISGTAYLCGPIIKENSKTKETKI